MRLWRRVAVAGAVALVLLFRARAEETTVSPRCALDPALAVVVDPALLYTGAELAAGRNAYPLLRSASANLPALPGSLPPQISDRLVYGRETRRLRGLLAVDAAPQQLLDEALGRGQLQFPAHGAVPGFGSFRQLALTRLARGALRVADGDPHGFEAATV